MTIKVKVLSTVNRVEFERQLPDCRKAWNDCEFVFDPRERQYDWLVVYEDFARAENGGRNNSGEPLACDPAHTLLVTTEPSTIKTYGSCYVNQFGYVLTSQQPWALPHPRRIYSQPALRWFYGVGRKGVVTLDQMRAAQPAKTKLISTVCSNKRQRHTLHNRRYLFTQRIKAALPQLEVFGHGVRAMDDKAEALDPYRYHIAIENFIGQHHWTEKLSDAFLGCALPFYYGCPNAASYFPAASFIPIDIFDFESALETIQRASRDDGYGRRLPQMLEARRRVLEEYNLFAVVSRIISSSADVPRHSRARVPGTIYPRRVATRKTCTKATLFLLEKTGVHLRHRLVHLMPGRL
jgi:hypothetical protein